ncbi:MAG TPA: FHA domain-containing protein [Solirubrobacteraceae bacterium]|nr:FHA domain-containing protein [Solirubrobacteraceae bacterium]
MESFTQGTMPGSGAFRCASCGHIFTLTPPLADTHSCPQCASSEVVRETLGATTRFQRAAAVEEADSVGREAWVARARSMIEEPGEYLALAEEEEIRLVPLQREWTRIGRSLAADVRFDDPTVSRRHALIVRQADGVRVLDDRSLNGVFVNGERVEWRVLEDGDEILVGRHRLTYLCATESATFAAQTGSGEGELQRA